MIRLYALCRNGNHPNYFVKCYKNSLIKPFILQKPYGKGFSPLTHVCTIQRLSSYSQLFFLENLIFPYTPLVQQTRKNPKGAVGKEKKGKPGKNVVQVSDEVLKEVINPDSLRLRMKGSLEKLQESFIKNLSLRSSGGIETINVSLDGTVFPLNEIAQIFRKNPELLVINLSSFPEGLEPVKQALLDCGMNLHPQQEGTTIYVPMPKVTREQREGLAKSAKVLFNKTKTDLTEIQNKFNKEAQKQKGTVSEDLIFSVSAHIRYIYELHVSEAETMLKNKVKELLGEK